MTQEPVVAIGLDIGGSKIAGEVRTGDGEVLASAWRAHSARGAEAVVDLLSEVASGLLAEAGSAGPARGSARSDGLSGPITVGVAVAGWLDAPRRHVRRAVNLGLDDVPLADALSAATGLSVLLENDGDAAALAEQVLHHPRARSLVALTAGTGLGGGIILDGVPVHGAAGLAGELGHMPIGEPTRTCACGGSGCAELYLSGAGLVTQARESGLAVPGGLRELVVLARGGEPDALGVLHRAADVLARWLALLVPVVDPDVVVLGGSAGLAIAEFVLPRAGERLATSVSMRGIVELPDLTVSRCGPGAGATGAALLALAPAHRAVSRRVRPGLGGTPDSVWSAQSRARMSVELSPAASADPDQGGSP